MLIRIQSIKTGQIQQVTDEEFEHMEAVIGKKWINLGQVEAPPEVMEVRAKQAAKRKATTK